MVKKHSRPAHLWNRGVEVYIKRVAYVPGGEAIVDRSYKLSVKQFNNLLYDPMDCPNLPNAFAKVIDGKTAIRFVENWGLLGYTRLQHMAEAEPLVWVLRQARSVRFILNLVEKLHTRGGYLEELISFLKRESVNREGVQFRHSRHRYIFGVYDLAFDADYLAKGFFAPAGLSPDETQSLLLGRTNYGSAKLTDGALVKELAYGVIAACVNGNTVNMRRFFDDRDGKLNNCMTYKALIEVIWHQVGDIVLQIQEGKEMRVCDECQTPFLVTDGRQRFCPSLETEDPYSWRQSACGLRYRQRKHRQNDNRKEAKHERSHTSKG